MGKKRAKETPEGLSVRNAEVRRVRVGDIVDNPANFRTHDVLQKTALEATVDEIGWYGYPDVFEHPEHPGKVMLVDGELRSQHLRAQYGDDAFIDVNVCDFTVEEARKALATKDPIAGMAGADLEKEAELLRGLEADNAEFAALIHELAERERIDLEPLPANIWDAAPIPEPSDELTEKWNVSRGSVYDLEGRALITVACGDSTVQADVEQTIDDGVRPFLLTTTPPAQTSGACYELFTGPVAYVWYDDRTVIPDLVRQLHAAKFEVRAQLIWRRPGGRSRGSQYAGHHETCLYVVRSGQSAKWNGSRTESTVWDGYLETPPDVRPLDITARPLINHGKREDPVYDPFGDIGQTAVASYRMGRMAYILESDPAKVAVILERLEMEGASVQAYRRIA